MKTIEPTSGKTNTRAILFIFASFLPLFFFLNESIAVNTEGKAVDSRINTGISRTIAEYEPAVAVRASGCLTCHAKIASNYITDFGYGSPYFFANPAGNNKAGLFNGHIYGDFIAEPGKTGWLTAEFKKKIIIPVAPIDFDLEKAAGDSLPDKSNYHEALKAVSLAGYLGELEKEKENSARIVEKNRVFIGVPDPATLEEIFDIGSGDSINIKFLKNNPDVSPEVTGIEIVKNGNYFTNTGEIQCDGDLFIRGTLLLDKPVIVTNEGCRIYATGPVFLQKEITFKNSGRDIEKNNLQIVSSEAIFLGVGREKCGITDKADPMALRLLKTPARPSIFTRAAYKNNIDPQRFTQDLYERASLIPLEDSTCHDKNIGFERLLLNAPVINSRYSGKFKGLVIAEYALFWQGKTEFEFDPVFKKVPVLPMLEEKDYLLVE